MTEGIRQAVRRFKMARRRMAVARADIVRLLADGWQPRDKDDWRLDLGDGGSLAHHVAASGFKLASMPEDGWMMRDVLGDTVAHVAARNGVLPEFPPGWEGWKWKNHARETVGRALREASK